ncbi:hemin ABC transporter substrate-binding protein [Paracoccus sp. p4-l81]|uniref:heme/hemin ABC transporter substrate-binding protein n=1 Tax=Paracoccus sp. p4-l81 TaxID=3342806 RepID=UPI0035BA0FBE
MMRALICATALTLLPGAALAADRVLSIGGSVTETVFALDAGDRLVGRDTTSTFPEAALALTDVGYMRALSPEGVLSVGPDLILLESGAGPAETLQTLAGTGIATVTVPDGFSPEGVLAKIDAVARALDAGEKGDAVKARLQADFDAVLARVAAAPGPKPRVLFILGNQGGRLMGAGQDSAADAMIALAGGVNAVQGFTGYKALTDEAVATAAPDIIVAMARGEGGPSAIAGNDELLRHPALAQTPAGQAGRVVRMRGTFLLGFGPRTPEAIGALHEAIYPAGS